MPTSAAGGEQSSLDGKSREGNMGCKYSAGYVQTVLTDSETHTETTWTCYAYNCNVGST